MTTAGKRSSLVTTERTKLTAADFGKGIINLDGGDEESLNILVYGDSNAGKTRLAGTLPRNTFWLVCEPGFKSASRWRKAQGLEQHRGARKITNSAEAWAAVEWLEQNERYRKLEWLVIDGVSTMQDRFRLGYTAEAFDINPASRAHRNLPDRPDYFNTQNFLKAWFPRIIDLPVNLLVTAHAYRTDRTDNGELLGFPGFQGKVTETSNAISGLMDVTAYMESRQIRHPRDPKRVRNRRRLWFTSPNDFGKDDLDVRYIAGDKFDALGTHMDDPTMEKIQALINGEEQNA